jgi:NAD(P)-dependent dehydrogenase (short-subunit alcohol dehydrogenase family)
VASILITGGASGIGLAALRAFRARGDSVVLADVNDAASREVVAEDLLGPAHAIHCDLSRPDAPRQAVEAAIEFAGSLDVVFANAGVLEAAPLADWSVERWDRTMAVNLRAPFFLAQAAASHLAESKISSIIFTASTGALRGHAGMPAYAASKAALLNLVRALADELSPEGIRVNAICPGWIDTPFNDAFWHHQSDPDAALQKLVEAIPLRRQGKPEDVAGAVLFLASADSAYITGQAIVVDGGYSAV